MKTILTVLALFAAVPSFAANTAVYKSTQCVTSETRKIPGANAGAVASAIIISSPTAGGATYELYDSSDVFNLGAKESLIKVSCAQVGIYPIETDAEYGLAHVSSGTCRAVLKYLDHK